MYWGMKKLMAKYHADGITIKSLITRVIRHPRYREAQLHRRCYRYRQTT